MRQVYTCLSVLICLTMTACASSTPRSPDALQPPASLRQPCPDLSQLNDGTGAALLRWGVVTARLYRECQSRHKELVEAWPK
jgi:hypothetical protein